MSELGWLSVGSRTDAGYTGPDRRCAVSVGELIAYRGPDRRGTRHAGGAGALLDPVRVVVAAAVGGAAVVALWCAGWELATAVLRALAGGMFLIAGVGLLIGWRASGRTRSALFAVSLVVGGSVFSAIQPFARLVHQDALLGAAAPGCLLATGVPALIVAARCARMNAVNSQVRPVRAAVTAMTIAAAALGFILLLRADVGPLDQALPWCAALLTLGTCWRLVGALIAAEARANGLPLCSALTAGLQLFAGIYLVAGVGVLGRPWALFVSAAAASLAGAALACFAGSSLAVLLRQQGTSALRLAGALGDTTRVLADEQARREELVHDARSAVASLRLANGTLARYREQLDQQMQAELHSAFGAELGRLAELFDAKPSHAAEDFDLAETVRPLVRLAQDGGVRVELDMPASVAVHGVRRDTATVVHTLLTNAARYAAGSAVDVRVEARAYDVRLLVADHGPGVAREEREAVSRRGFRGASSRGSEGSGLGLFVARRLMADQDGGLVVEETAGGGACFVVTIPAANTAELGGSTASCAADEQLAQRAAS